MSVASTRIAVEFLSQLAVDRDADRLAPLAEYLARFPGHEEIVAEEYLRACRVAEHAANADFATDAEQHIGGYRLLEELGRGGQAVVWKAHDARLDRHVALKVVSRPSGAEELTARFRREARATAALEHPHVCALFDSGTDDACAWLAMQYVEGRTLAAWLDEQRARRGADKPPTPDDIEQVLSLLEKVARALHAAHLRGIVHRDIKPANIMVRPDGEPVILDFGVALLTEQGPQLTRTGDSLGTPAYMSPEQLGDQRGDVGPRTDVWALGATLYEACTGQRAFRQARYEQLVRAIVDTEPVDPRKLAPKLSDDLTAVIQTALCKRLSGRYASALDLADDLRCVRERRPTTARTVGPGARLLRWSQRNPLLASVSGVLIVGTLLASGVILRKNWALADSNAALNASNAQLQIETASAEREALAKTAALATAERETLAKTAALATAERETAAKAAALAEYERMADILRLRSAVSEADALYPLQPELVPELEAWQARHAALFARLPLHEQRLAELRVQARPYTAADRERDYAEELDKAARIDASIPALNPQYRASFEEERDALLAETRAQRSWDFGDDVDTQFRHDELAELCAQLAEVVRSDDGAVRSVARRLELCRVMQAATVDQHAEDWARAIARVSENPRYAGFTLDIQPGLVPLGADPASSLEEFLLWESAPQQPLPTRNATGRFEVGEDTGVILVLLPPGECAMGAQASNPSGQNYDPLAKRNEEPITRVPLDAFLISKFELTQGQWLAATGTNPSAYYAGYSFQGIHAPVDLRHPVERVSWTDCHARLRELGLLLPTEAQWEYAARAGGSSVYSGAASDAELSRFANLAGAEVEGFFLNFSAGQRDGFVIHAPVGSFEANAFGLHDMTGNVWEWCRDRFVGYYGAVAPGDGERASMHDNRVYRGGAATSIEPDLRVSLRTEEGESLRFSMLGVRPVRALRR